MSKIEINYRHMTPEDLDQVVELDQHSFATPWPRKSFEFEINENEASTIWIAEVEENGAQKIVGYIVLWLLVDEVHIGTLTVDDNYRRNRIAFTLLCKSMTELQAKGAVTATLEVRESNAAGQNLYRKFGFQLVGKRPAYYKDNQEDAMIMEMRELDKDHLMIIGCLKLE